MFHIAVQILPMGEAKEKEGDAANAEDSNLILAARATLFSRCGQGLSFLGGSARLDRISSPFRHLSWDGLVPWELIMPSFMFMMGTSLPFALSRRREQGQSFRRALGHVLRRVVTMALLGAILYSLHAGHYHVDPIETLTQLGLSYLGTFLILQFSFAWQVVVAAWAPYKYRYVLGDNNDLLDELEKPDVEELVNQ